MNPPLCINCAEYVNGSCRHPRNLARSLVDGELHTVNTPDYLRKMVNLCDTHGAWFKAKESKDERKS